MRVSPLFFPLFGGAHSRPDLLEEESREGSHQRVILSHGYWQDRYAGDRCWPRAARGRQSYQIGCAAEHSVCRRLSARVYVPIPYGADAANLENWHSNNYAMLARLRPGATIEQARAENQTLNARLIADWPIPNGASCCRMRLPHGGPTAARGHGAGHPADLCCSGAESPSSC
jgi:hypothetical protein